MADGRRTVALTHEQARVLNILVHNATKKEAARVEALRPRRSEVSQARLQTLLSLGPELDHLLKRFG